MVVLAAGASTRMGTSKQLLPVQGESLLHRTASTAVQASVGEVWVVLGSEAEKHLPEILDLPVNTIIHHEWQRGMGSSIKAALAHVAPRSYDAILFMVCDQPHVTPNHLANLIDALNQQPSISVVASAYGDSVGVPAVFRFSRFAELAQLSDEAGAKRVIEARPESTLKITFERGLCDLDTPEDYQRFLHSPIPIVKRD